MGNTITIEEAEQESIRKMEKDYEDSKKVIA